MRCAVRHPSRAVVRKRQGQRRHRYTAALYMCVNFITSVGYADFMPVYGRLPCHQPLRAVQHSAVRSRVATAANECPSPVPHLYP